MVESLTVDGRVVVSPSPEVLCYILEQDTLSFALYWLNPGRMH